MKRLFGRIEEESDLADPPFSSSHEMQTKHDMDGRRIRQCQNRGASPTDSLRDEARQTLWQEEYDTRVDKRGEFGQVARQP